MKAENKILKKAAESVSRQTGILIRYNSNASQKDKGAEYQIEVIVPLDDESKAIDYTAQVKTRISDAVLGNAAIQAKNLPGRLVLVSEYVPPAQAEKLRQLNISFFDTAGNAYFNAPGVYVFVSGNKAKVSREKPLGLFRPAGIKLLLAFLIQPGLENTDYRTIAGDTGVPRTTVGELIADLERAGYLARRGNSRFLLNKQELIKRWVEEYSEKFRIKLKPVRYHSSKFTGRWWEEVDISEYKAVWGGETGGAILTKHLKPQTATVYADSTLARFQAKYGLVRDERGEIEILRKFWKFGEIDNVAPPLVVYADLLATADERNLETAQIIYDRYLASLTKENS
jgi:hypothetical protein